MCVCSFQQPERKTLLSAWIRGSLGRKINKNVTLMKEQRWVFLPVHAEFCIYPSLYHLSAHLAIHSFIWLSVHPSHTLCLSIPLTLSVIHSPIHLSIHPSTQSTNPPIQSSSIKISWLSIHHIFYFHRECRIRFSIQKLLRFHSLTLKLSYEQTCDLFLQRAEALAWPSTHRSNESCLNCEALDPNPRLKERDLDMFRRWDWMQTCSPKSQSKITRRQDCSELTWLCFQVLECWLRRVISLWW